MLENLSIPVYLYKSENYGVQIISREVPRIAEPLNDYTLNP